jgi:hypothetical protein
MLAEEDYTQLNDNRSGHEGWCVFRTSVATGGSTKATSENKVLVSVFSYIHEHR